MAILRVLLGWACRLKSKYLSSIADKIAMRDRTVKNCWAEVTIVTIFVILWQMPVHGYWLCPQPDGSVLYTDNPRPGCQTVQTPELPHQKSPTEMQDPVKGSKEETEQPVDSKNPGAARRELERLNIPFTEDEFISRVRQGDIKIVELFSAAGMNPNTKEKSDMERPILIWAAAFGHTDTVRLLLDKGADVNGTNKYRVTALMAAAFQGHTGTVRELLGSGANVNARDTEDRIALMFAAAGGGPTATDIVKILLDRGADKNAINKDGGTALIVAASNGYTEIVRVLLAAGVEVNTADKHGMTALKLAIAHSYASIVQLLMEAGARE